MMTTATAAAWPWAQVLAVAIGAAIGALLRWRVGLWLNAGWAGFPLGTLLVNAVGGLLVGIALAWFERSPNELLRLALVTGFLGGLTTFSAFSVESLLLLQRAQWALALAHTGAHVLGALAFAALGFKVAQAALA
ncbi:MAG: camphor resistance protein CrcB [Methylibium sp. NZG]|nr:MAG: camphor resistance protein CrcB [Methylibium sp. NZG]